ncbi:MAG: EAL domain-containing protein [Spirulinaceae cyanobacterium]
MLIPQKKLQKIPPLPLRVLLVLPFLVQICAIVGITGWLSFRNGQNAVNNIAAELQGEVQSQVEHYLDDYLALPQQINQINLEAAKLDLLNLEDFSQTGKYFWQQMQVFDVGYINYATTEGEFIGIERLDNREILINEVPLFTPGKLYIHKTDSEGNRTKQIDLKTGYDPRLEAWYADAVEAGKPVWSAIYQWEDKPEVLSISSSYPVYDEKQNLQGVIGVDLILSQINIFLSNIDLDRSGETFILERNGLLVASSANKQSFDVVDGEVTRKKAVNSKDIIVSSAVQYLQKHFGQLTAIEKPANLAFYLDNQKQFLQVLPYQDALGLDWLVITVIPESDFISQVQSNTRNTILLCLGALIIAIIVGILTSRWISKPIRELSGASKAIANGKLDQKVEVGRVKELGVLARSFNKMTQQLHDSFAALARNNQDLEKKVKLRTTALEESEAQQKQLNQQLEERVQQRTAELEKAKRRMQFMALHDPLTNLPNRTLFLEKLADSLDSSRKEPDYLFAVLFLDCDRFKVINDSLGHSAGDDLLIILTSRLISCLRPGDIIARLGGDEFAILLNKLNSTEDAITVAQAIQQTTNQPCQLNHYQVFMNFSIGICPGWGYQQPEHLLRDADTAMYAAKASGKGAFKVFDAEMHANAVELLNLETDLRKAIEREEFLVYYQPIVCLETGKIKAFEALVRWQHPQRGFVSPGQFIPIAEETGLIIPLGMLVLRQACHQLQRWQKLFLPEDSLTMSVNLSVKQFSQPDLLGQIDQVITETNLDSRSLKLEITESAIMGNQEDVLTLLNQIKERQIQLSIDDFGTGYSSFSYLHRLPFDTLKIDRSFVSNLDGVKKHREIVEAIATLAQKLKMQVIAEGIETEQQLAHLRSLGCDFGQGWFFSKPLSQESAEEMLLSSPKW